MPRKRVAVDGSLSGGTGDVNPQQMTVRVTQSAADTFTSVSLPNPVPRYPGANNRAVVLEVLRVDFYNENTFYIAGNANIFAALSTRQLPAAATGATAFEEPSTFAFYNERTLFATAAGFTVLRDNIQTVNLTDEAGHGHLVATDNIQFACGSTSTGIVNTISAKITYRMKEIGLAEYVGIVQSQQ